MKKSLIVFLGISLVLDYYVSRSLKGQCKTLIAEKPFANTKAQASRSRMASALDSQRASILPAGAS